MAKWQKVSGDAGSFLAERRLSRTEDGTELSETITGTDRDDELSGAGGDDLIFGLAGDDDSIQGEAGFDVLFGNRGEDKILGGTEADFVYGGKDDDTLFGDSGFNTAKGSDLASDRLDGGSGDDRLVQGDGNDVMSGGGGADEFYFRWQDPMVALAAGTGRAFVSITSYEAGEDQLLFDAVGAGKRDRLDSNFIDGGAGDGTAGGTAATFFSGAAAASNGEAVMVLTDQEFASGALAVGAAQNEAEGDFVLYFNSTVGVASLLYVDGADAAHSIARFTGIESLAELQGAGFSADDFLFV